MALAKLATLVSTFPGPGLPPEWISTGLPSSVARGAAQVPASTDFVTGIQTVAFYDPTNSSIYGRLALSTPRSYTTTPAAPAFVPYNRIGQQQPGGAQVKTLSGLIPGFTVGQQATGQMKGTLDNYETLIGDHIEAVGVGLPNGQGDATSILNALQGETRFVVFFCPMVPNNSTGSIHGLLAGQYDTQIIAMINSMVAKGFAGTNVSIRITEYNSGFDSHGAPTSYNSFPWSTGHIDPQTGTYVGMANFKLAAAYFENLIRAHGYAGYIEWSGGNFDGAAAPIATAMPTHAVGANKALTLWGWDLYAATPYGVGKDNVTACWAAANTIYDAYLTYVKANGYMMCHGEYGQGYSSNSQYSLNDTDQWWPLFYAKIAANAQWVAYAMHYQQNQPYTPGTILSESHQIAFCGGMQGVASTTVGTGPNAIGATTSYGNGTSPTAATMGTLHNVADSGTWVFTNDPNRIKSKTSWVANFGGTGGKGAAHLGVPYVVPPVPVTAGPKTQVVLTPGGSHSPAVAVLMEFDYNQTQNLVTVNFLDDGTGVTTAAVGNNIWFSITDNGTNVIWATSVDGVTYTTARTSGRPAWWNSTDGVQVWIKNHNDDGTQTIAPLSVSNINNTTGVIAPPGPDAAFFDKLNITSAVPNPVSNLVVHVTGNSAALIWTPPALGVVQGYIVSATPLNSSSPALPNQTVTSPSEVFSNGIPGSSYLFTVTPYNSAGSGTGTTTGAVTFSATSGSGTGGVPTGAITTGVPSSLPITPLPTAYYPITLTTQSDDGDALATAALQRFSDLSNNGWRPYPANPEVVALQVASYIAADLRSLVRSVGTSMFAAYGSQVLQNPQRVDAPSQIVTTWTASDTIGHTIPAGTQVSYPASGSQPLTFTTRGDIVIAPGTSTATAITMLSDQTGAYTNQVPLGALELQANILWLTGVTVTTAATGGQDAESDTAYLNRLIGYIRTLGQTIVLPADYSVFAQASSPSVYRAYTVPNYDANNPGVLGVDRVVSVYMLGPDGLPVTPDVAAAVGAKLSALRETNFTVVTTTTGGAATISPSYVAVNVTTVVVCRAGYAQADVQNSVLTALGDYLNPAFWEGGLVTPPVWTGRILLRRNDVAAVIASVPGVDHIDSLSIAGGAVPVPGTDNYQLAPTAFATAVLPAGLYSSPSHWTTPSVLTVTANAPAFS